MIFDFIAIVPNRKHYGPILSTPLTPDTHMSHYYGNSWNRRQTLDDVIYDYVSDESGTNYCNHHKTQRPTAYPMKCAQV